MLQLSRHTQLDDLGLLDGRDFLVVVLTAVWGAGGAACGDGHMAAHGPSGVTRWVGRKVPR
eukprot:5373161-Prymnesium_polylepis.1